MKLFNIQTKDIHKLSCLGALIAALTKKTEKPTNSVKDVRVPTEGWEERFDLEMNACLIVNAYETKKYEDIKKFIASELARQKEESYEEGFEVGMKQKRIAQKMYLDLANNAG